ncbi:MAG: M48 family metallopeptidase [gamma proteobacterium symbiont of Bathyaustriella thionipta]|nr:M48 family metallopeptidase [gamma proteobacterium symbiont of Bathyaustriella thionipta]MCU7951598.1 M48 family metallopeptidase [gamma proteobacterium symbiont of Bathyaustriella thionipta]MCU7951970.1 M48 family metallopeptidase [gamma proteobacterium symbiont of Bathyaustriella thionipta]MCU7958298.1 M48 family metallopeptidase [gamma proteobacterium symbiont of Bathyaustriella thionipta]MCU7965631.1 M48 family metallopeptidase [gamma proteobacterium symbiont of Bathyaustriella thionipta
MKPLLVIPLILFVLTMTACTTSPTGRSQFMLVSPEQAISASKEAYVKTLKPLDDKGKIDSDPVVTKRVKLVTGRLISQAIVQYPHTRHWEWSVKVIDDPEMVNAWCMAGGKMAIYTGLLKKVKPSDDELAQVMGHEIAHALANHTAEKMSVQMASQIGMVALAVAANDSKYGGVALTGAALAASMAIELPNSRTAEIEADRMGIELAAKAGYNPNAAVTLWEKMGRVGGSSPPEFLSTHPAPGNRQKKLRELAPKMMPLYKQKIARPVYPL